MLKASRQAAGLASIRLVAQHRDVQTGQGLFGSIGRRIIHHDDVRAAAPRADRHITHGGSFIVCGDDDPVCTRHAILMKRISSYSPHASPFTIHILIRPCRR